MATDFGLAQISAFFDEAYGKPIPESSYPLWRRILHDVDDAMLAKAAHHLIGKRQIARSVTPGEMVGAVRMIGGIVEKPSGEFMADPVVKALESRFQASMAEPGISMIDWLQQEGLPTFRAAIEKYQGKKSAHETIREIWEGI